MAIDARIIFAYNARNTLALKAGYATHGFG